VTRGGADEVLRAVLCCGLAVIATSARAQSYTNVFDYCAAIGTIDRPDSRFSGIFPASKAADAFGIEPGALHENAFAWRCMNHAVWVCAQLNSPICGKANVSREATKPMADYCQMDPDSAVIPLVVMGQEHPPAYDWACRQGVASVAGQTFTPDARGYPPYLWKQLAR
jgi:hypothetical protein